MMLSSKPHQMACHDVVFPPSTCRYLLMEFSPPPGVTMQPSASKRLLDINEKNNGGATPLELAAQHGHKPVVELACTLSCIISQ